MSLSDQPENFPEDSIVESTTAESEEDAKPERTAKQWTIPVLMALVIIGGPLVLNAIMPGAAGWPIVGLLAVTSLVLGFADGWTFRMNATLTVVAAASFFITMIALYNEGTWIYLLAVILLTNLATFMGNEFHNDRKDS